MARGMIDPGHEQKRAVLRVVGPVLVVAGVVMLVMGAIGMFSPAWSHHTDPHRGFMTGERSFEEVRRESLDQFHSNARSSFQGFALAAAGMVCLAIGIGISRFAYMGAVARYMAGEIAPVGADTFNYVAGSTKEGVTDVAEAITEGVHAAGSKRGKYCTECGVQNPVDAKFCTECGHAFPRA